MIGTFWLVLAGCGSAVLAVGFPGIVFTGVALSFAALLALRELVLTCGFSLVIIMGVTDTKRAPRGSRRSRSVASTPIHLISIPVTNTSVNPARSTSVAPFAGGWGLRPPWLSGPERAGRSDA